MTFEPDSDFESEDADQPYSFEWEGEKRTKKIKKKKGDNLKSLSQSARKGQLKSAKIAMIFIGVLTLLLNLAVVFFADSIAQQQAGQAGRGAAVAIQLSGALFAILGIVFIVLGMFVYRYPVACTVTGLVLYIASQAITAMLDPATIVSGIIVKIIIIVVLVKAVKSALAHEREAAKGVA